MNPAATYAKPAEAGCLSQRLHAETAEQPGQDAEEPGRTEAEYGQDAEEPGRTEAEPGKDAEEPGRTEAELGQDAEELGRTVEDCSSAGCEGPWNVQIIPSRIVGSAGAPQSTNYALRTTERGKVENLRWMHQHPVIERRAILFLVAILYNCGLHRQLRPDLRTTTGATNGSS